MNQASRPLHARYDVAVLDLDGVVYIGADAVPGAVQGLGDARAAGMHLAFVTNNASRPPEDVARHLGDLGIDTVASEVVTSAQAAARLVAGQVLPGSPVFVIGGPGLEQALRERELVPVTDPDAGAVAVVQGFGPDMPWRQVIDGALLVRQGLPWVASNTDLTVPTPRGAGPGNGTLVALVAEYAGRTPLVAGKPEAPLFQETLARVGGDRPLVVGDRIDTDIAGAIGMGWDSLLLMSGVTGLPELASVPASARPTYVGADLTALAEAPAPVAPHAGPVTVDGWTAEVVDHVLRVTGDGGPHAWWHAAAAVCWGHLDAHGQPAVVAGARPGSVTS